MKILNLMQTAGIDTPILVLQSDILLLILSVKYAQ